VSLIFVLLSVYVQKVSICGTFQQYNLTIDPRAMKNMFRLPILSFCLSDSHCSAEFVNFIVDAVLCCFFRGNLINRFLWVPF
jgi:hypothetical protein